MPAYIFTCDTCHFRLEEFLSIQSDHPTKCPDCGSPEFYQAFSEYKTIGLVRGQPTTVGQLGEANTKKLGKEQFELMQAEWARRPGWTGPLPEGAKPIEIPKQLPPWREGRFGNPKLDKPLDIKKIPTPEKVGKYIETGVM